MEHVAKMAPRDAPVAGFDAPRPPPDSSLGFVTLSLTFGLGEDTWSTCAVKAKRNLLERANGPVATTKADRLGFSQILGFTDVDKLCPLRPRSKDPPEVQRRQGDDR